MIGHDGWIGSWSPGLGDPTPMGWLSVILYLAAAWQCLRVLRPAGALRSPCPAEERRLWWALVLLMVMLGINKQLDLQSALTEIARLIARAQGWYETRRLVQLWFVAAVGLGALGVALRVVFLAAGMPMATRISLFGCVALLGFVFIRAASFHHFDVLIRYPVWELRLNGLLETGGALVIGAGARMRARA